jgi:hypothetical protein
MLLLVIAVSGESMDVLHDDEGPRNRVSMRGASLFRTSEGGRIAKARRACANAIQSTERRTVPR